MVAALNSQHRTHVAFQFGVSQQVLTLTPTPANTTQYAGDIIIYDSFGVEVARSPYDYTSDADATADEIVTGILVDLTGADVDNFSTLSGTDTVIITVDVGYSAAMDNTGPGVITAAPTGGAAIIGSLPADAAAWVVAEGNTTAKRIMVEELDPAFLGGAAAVPNADMQTRVGEAQLPHQGVPDAKGGAMKVRLYGTGNTYAAGELASGTMLGKLLGNALGGYARGGYTDVTTVNTQVSLDLTDASLYAVGQVVWIESQSDLGYLWPTQITAIVSNTITLDMAVGFTVQAGDKVYGSEIAYFLQEAINDPTDPDYASPNFLVQKGPNCWAGSVGHLGLTALTMERGQQPKFDFALMAARGYPPGDGGPAEPNWTGAVEGYPDVAAVGRGTHLQLQQYGTTTFSETCLFSASLDPGVPVEPVDGVTECTAGAPGWMGHVTVPTPSVLEVVVPLTETQQTQWTTGTLFKLRYFQVAAVGYGWCVHTPKAFLMDRPEVVLEGQNRWRLRFQFTDDLAGTTEMAKAKLLLARS